MSPRAWLVLSVCVTFSASLQALRVYKCTDLNDETVTYSFKRCGGDSTGGLIDVIDNSPEAVNILRQMEDSEPLLSRKKSPHQSSGKTTRFSADARQCESALKQLETESRRAVAGDSSRQFEQTLKIKNLKANYEGACGKLSD